MATNYKGVLLGGAIAIDFCNTVDARPGFLTSEMTIDGEHLTAVDDFFAWAQSAKLISSKLRRIILEAVIEQTAMKRLLNEALLLRELLFRTFLATIQDRYVNDRELMKLNEFMQSLPSPRIIANDKKLALDWTPSPDSPQILLGRILQDAIEVLTSEKTTRLKYCAAEDCGWLFLDNSKNNSRRWCDMADCGNRVKAERHYRKIIKRRKSNALYSPK